jgi:hypothetical protein
MMLLTFSDRKLFDEVRDTAQDLQNQGAKLVKINDSEVYTIELSQMTYLPTHDDCIHFWTALENGTGSGSPMFDELKNDFWDNIKFVLTD